MSSVVIDIGVRQASGEHNPTQTDLSKKSTVSPASRTILSTAGVAIVTTAAQQSINYSLANIGKWTGNSKLQMKVNAYKGVAGDLMVATGAIATSLATGNPIMIATFLASKGIELGTTIADKFYEFKWEKEEQQRNLKKAGYNNAGELIGWRH